MSRADYDARLREEVLNAEAESLVIAVAAFGYPAHAPDGPATIAHC